MGKVSPVVIEEFQMVAGVLEELALDYGFDLSTDDDVNRLNQITDGERISRGLMKGEVPSEWAEASFPERALGAAFDFLYRLEMAIERAPDDKNECECCNSEANALRYLFTLNYMAGFLRAHPILEYTVKEQSEFFSALGRSGAESRHAPMAELRAWAIEKYKENNWQSANQAAYELKDAVLDHGRKINARLSESNAQRTIAEWFRKSV